MPCWSDGETCASAVKRTLFDSLLSSLVCAWWYGGFPFRQPCSLGRNASALAMLSVLVSVDDAASDDILKYTCCISVRNKIPPGDCKLGEEGV